MTDQTTQAQPAPSAEESEVPEVQPTAENTLMLQYIVLSSGMVLQIGKSWPAPNGKADKESVYQDAEGKDHQLQIGAIFYRPEETETVEEPDTDEPGLLTTRTTTVGAHYEVWSEPCSPHMRLFRVQAQNVVYDSALAPYKYAGDLIRERVQETIVDIGEDEGAAAKTETSTAASTSASTAPAVAAAPPNGASSASSEG